MNGMIQRMRMNRNWRRVGWGLVLLLAGCGGGIDSGSEDVLPGSTTSAVASPTPPSGGTQLLISSAASMQDAFLKLEPAFEEKYPRIDITFNYGGSGALQRQIEQGAPADLILTAGSEPLIQLAEKDLIDSNTLRTVVSNELVFVIPSDSTMSASEAGALQHKEWKRIAIGEPRTVPAGAYAKESLAAARLWEALLGRLVYAKDVRQVLTYVETGNADGGFVYRTDAMASEKVKVAFMADHGSHRPIEYLAAVVNSSKHSSEAFAFIQYLLSPEAQSILESFGFHPAPAREVL